MNEQVNEDLMRLLNCFNIHDDARGSLYTALIARDEAAMDHIRMAAANLGVRPALTAAVLSQTGLGTPLTQVETEQLQRRVNEEMAEAQAEFFAQHGLVQPEQSESGGGEEPSPPDTNGSD